MLRTTFLLVFSALSICILAASDKIAITGSTTVFPIAEKCAEAFESEHPEVEFEIASTGSSVGISSIIDGSADIGNASRPAKQKEIDAARKSHIELFETPIAMDGVAVVVHPENPVTNISLQQLQDIYTGKITSWKALGGEDAPILIISRDPSSGTFEVFNTIVLRKKELSPTAILVQGNQSVADAVAMTRYAIGYIGFGFLQNDLKAVSIEDIEPTDETILSGHYAISRKLFMYTDGKPEKTVGEFIRFILSPKGQQIVRETGFLPVR